MKDLKYLSAYTIPLMAVIALSLKGYFSYLTLVYAFGIIPVLELLLPLDGSNLSEEERDSKSENPFFDWMLFINIPLVFSLLIYTLIDVSTHTYATYELIGLAFSTGIVLGSNGINVAHELGHRKDRFSQLAAKFLLMPSLYMHFFIEHNFGHHLHAATAEDPATARYNQNVYSFWFTSVSRQYISAWKIQLDLLKRENRQFVSAKNDMLWYLLFQAAYLFVIYWFFGVSGLIFSVAVAVIGFLLLETINYIEHYGLRRNKLSSGRYERVKEIHSWNSNHIIGRVVLYELTRHSDHHYKASKKYQLLDYHNTSPQMPYGYPTSMVISLIPPLWFKIMNKRIPREMKEAF
ncbi:alkane 1-monooxygenase [Leptobacterium flavescens]|uniref:Alkane 1-monooxygenase n=1 Tax=Leptobacterium flavescens TaxID=472055 RepID=A0A6P0UNZ5_9FLAO|nr:alkane 1-monooxygenase [Leptobacterium flavescens]NER14212.1 alkane 1-monooxygenase [Leptobacterium flavescens]